MRGDRLANLGDAQFVPHLFKGENEGEDFLLSVGLFRLRGKEGLTVANEAVVLFLTGGEFAVVVFEDNPIAGRPRGELFDHLVDFALVTLLGSIFSKLKKVQDFLAFFRVASFFGLFGFQVITDRGPPRGEQAPRAFGLDRCVSSLLPESPKMLDYFVVFGGWLLYGREGLPTGLKQHLIDVDNLLRGAFRALLHPFSNCLAQLLRLLILASRRFIQPSFIDG